MRPSNFASNALLALASCLVTFALLEVALRLYDGYFRLESERAAAFSLLKSTYPVQFDATLGYVLKRDDRLGPGHPITVSTDADGMRANGNAIEGIQRERPILAIGDSFTFGDQVSDNETWPSALERLSHRRVINGGVPGYGIDQSYLRAMQLMQKYEPAVLIFSFIADDILRAELSQRTGVPKPYFELLNGELVLRDAHVKAPSPESFTNQVKNILAYSHAIHTLASGLLPLWWWSSSGAGQVRVHNEGEAVSCALIGKLQSEAARLGVTLYLMPQYSEQVSEQDEVAPIRNVLNCANARARVIDLLPSFLEKKSYDNVGYKALFLHHMTALGNEFVAKIIWQQIQGSMRP